MRVDYEYLFSGPGQFKVLKRWVDKQGKKHMMEYNVAYKKGEWMCDPKCTGFQVYKKCKHTLFLAEQMKLKDMGIIRKESKFDWYENLGVKEDG